MPMTTRPSTWDVSNAGPMATAMPASTHAAESHVRSGTPRLMTSSITGSTTTVIEIVKAPVETSKCCNPTRKRTL